MADENDNKKTKGETKQRWWHDRRKLAAAIAGFVIVAGAAIAIAYSQLKREDDVQNADVIAKFEKLASKALPKAQVGKLRDAMLGLEKLEDAGELARLLQKA